MPQAQSTEDNYLVHFKYHAGSEILHEPFRSAQFRPWKHLFQSVGIFRYSISESKYCIQIDWSSIKESIAWSEKLLRIKKEIEGGDTSTRAVARLTESINCYPNQSGPLRVAISTNCFQADEDGFRVLRKFFHDLMVLMNISCPGCADFSGWVFEEESHRQIKFRETFNASSLLLDYISVDARSRNIAQITTIPLSKVMNWYRKATLDRNVDYVASKGAPAALFALINSTKYGSGDPESLIWIAHALEAIYLPDRQGGLSILNRRIQQFLDLDDTDSVKAKKALQHFYNLRHAFVHGDSEILHPVHDYSSNQKIDRIIEKHDQPILLTTSLVIATIQKMIRKNFSEIDFYERSVGRN